MSLKIKNAQGKLEAIKAGSKYSGDAGAGTIQVLNPSLRRVDDLVGKLASVAAEVKNIRNEASVKMAENQDKVSARLGEATAMANTAINKAYAKLDQYKKFEDLASSDISIADQLKKASMITQTYGLSAACDGSIPVFRWNIFNTYSQVCCWMDHNNPRSFGGISADRWGDGNARADEMTSNIHTIKRFFSKRGTGDANLGAVACVEGYSIVHSTDDKRCGALFRIRGTSKKTSDTNFRVAWTYTGWSGWGNQASVALNKQNVWNGNCGGYCNRNTDFKLKSNSDGDRINTIVFMSGGTSPYYKRWYYRSNMLAFNGLKLPSGFEYIDDLSGAEGTWD